eukprot:SM000147S01107  [mRNA]  locus=s147:47283:48238:- [translate_table: standard]
MLSAARTRRVSPGPYLRASAPPEGVSPFSDPPPLPPFDAQEFLDLLAARGPGKFLAKRMRSNWLELYGRFLEGPNFLPWFRRRRAVAEQEQLTTWSTKFDCWLGSEGPGLTWRVGRVQHRLWRRARVAVDIHLFLPAMSEVELTDAFSTVERHLLLEIQAVSGKGGPATGMAPATGGEPAIMLKLRADLRAIYDALPRDMQQMLLFTPHRAALLQVGATQPHRRPAVEVGALLA